jgi:hypothetical protein
MAHGFIVIIKAALMLAIFTLAITAILYVLDIFQGEVAKDTLIKLMSVLGIFTAASMSLLVVAAIGSRNNSSSK